MTPSELAPDGPDRRLGRGLGLLLLFVVAGSMLQIVLVPHEVSGVNSARLARARNPLGAMPDRSATLALAMAPGGSLSAALPPAREVEKIPGEESPRPEEPVLEMSVVGPGEAFAGDLVTFTLLVEEAEEVAYAPLQLIYDPEVLGFVAAEEGTLLSSDGAETQFLAAPSSLAGRLEIAVSRVPPAGGISGSGTLCSVTFLAIEAGETRIITSGGELGDPSGRMTRLGAGELGVSVRAAGSSGTASEIEGDRE